MSTHHFKALFFDMDGLLVNTEPLYFEATHEILNTLGIELTKEWYIRENLGKGTSSFELAEQAGFPPEEVKTLRKKRNELYDELLKAQVHPISGVPEALAQLKGKFLMGVVTNSRRDHFESIMEKTNLRQYFSFFITSDDVENPKPDPEPYLKALEFSGFKKEECLVLEDSYRGLLAAKAAGLACYAIPDALTDTHNFSSADKILKNLGELPALISA